MLGEMLEWAIARRYIAWNPARTAKLPKDRSATDPDAPSVYKQSKAKESFTREQYASLMAVLLSADDDEFRIATPNTYFDAGPDRDTTDLEGGPVEVSGRESADVAAHVEFGDVGAASGEHAEGWASRFGVWADDR